MTTRRLRREFECSACEEMFARDGAMTPEFLAFDNFGMVCVECYAQLEARHASR